MKRILKFLSRLYPPVWRQRYGNEFEALLDDRPARAQDAFDVFQGALKMQMKSWTLVRITLFSCLVGCVAAVAVSFAVQPRYVSSGIILVTSRDGGAGGAHRGVDGLDDPAVRNDIVQATKDAFSSESLQSIIEEQKLYPQQRIRMTPRAVIDLMRKNININRVYPAPRRREASLVGSSSPSTTRIPT